MAVLSRKVVAPVALGVWAVALVVGVRTSAVLPVFADYYDFHRAQPAFGHATVATAFRHGYPVGVVLALATVIAGVWFLRQRESAAIRLLWFASAVLVLAGAWLVWALLAERSIYVLSLPA